MIQADDKPDERHALSDGLLLATARDTPEQRSVQEAAQQLLVGSHLTCCATHSNASKLTSQVEKMHCLMGCS